VPSSNSNSGPSSSGPGNAHQVLVHIPRASRVAVSHSGMGGDEGSVSTKRRAPEDDATSTSRAVEAKVEPPDRFEGSRKTLRWLIEMAPEIRTQTEVCVTPYSTSDLAELVKRISEN
jgi:hypothetical protein